jgi:hypothetical protein
MQHRLGMSYFSVSTGVVAIALSGILAKWAAIPGEASAFWRMLIATAVGAETVRRMTRAEA